MKVVWITGGSKGIGKATAIEMAKNGYKVVVTARNPVSFDQPNIEVVLGDVTDRKRISEIVDYIENKYGKISIAFLNAGGYYKSNTNMFSDPFRKTVDLNLNGVVNCLEFLLPKMIKQKEGHLIFMSSISGYGGIPNFNCAYALTKAAIINLAESLKLQLENRNIKVQVVSPSFVDTGLISKKVFNMPFLVTPEKAAKIIFRDINKNKFEICFPKSVVYFIKAMNLMPYPVYFYLIKKLFNFLKK